MLTFRNAITQVHIENLHSHNMKFQFIETLSHLGSEGGKTVRKSFENFEAFRKGVKSSDNVISK